MTQSVGKEKADPCLRSCREVQKTHKNPPRESQLSTSVKVSALTHAQMLNATQGALK